MRFLLNSVSYSVLIEGRYRFRLKYALPEKEGQERAHCRVGFIGAEILDKAEKDPVRLKISLFTWSEDFFPAKQLAWSTVQQF